MSHLKIKRINLNVQIVMELLRLKSQMIIIIDLLRSLVLVVGQLEEYLPSQYLAKIYLSVKNVKDKYQY